MKYIELASALLYFLNKVFLSLGKKTGWQIGIMAALVSIYYFFSIRIYLFIGLELSFLAILVYGLIFHEKPIKNQGYLYGIMLITMVLLFFILKDSSFLEFIISALFIVAIYFLAVKNWNLAWISFIVGHVLMAYFTYTKQQYIFASLQSASVFVGLFALYKGETKVI